MRLTQRLSDAVIRRLAVPAKDGDRHVQLVHWDRDLKGFGVLISSTGQKSYVVQRGAMTRRTIEKVDLISFEDARETALEWLRLMGKGIDPRAKLRADQNANLSLSQVLDRYLEARKKLRSVTSSEYGRILDRYLADWKHKPLASITAEMVLDRHKAIHEQVSSKRRNRLVTGEHSADGAVRLIRACWNFAADSDLIPTLPPKNPVKVLSKTKAWFVPKPRRRTTYIRDSDLAGFWTKLNELPADECPPGSAEFIKTLLLTGLRIGTVRQLKWTEHVDLRERVLRISAGMTKAGRTLDLPLSNELHELLTEWQKRGVEPSGWVFPSTVAGKHLVDVRPAFDWIAQKAEQPRVTPHDLRRTFATAAKRSGLSEFDVKALIHHALGDDVTSGYISVDVEELRAPMQKVTDRLMHLCNPTPVIDLAERRKARRTVK